MSSCNSVMQQFTKIQLLVNKLVPISLLTPFSSSVGLFGCLMEMGLMETPFHIPQTLQRKMNSSATMTAQTTESAIFLPHEISYLKAI